MQEHGCRICGSTESLTFYQARESMFGMGDRFQYFQCGTCGCLQIASIPEDLARFYPDDYYAHQEGVAHYSRLRRAVRDSRNRYAFFRRGVVGRVLNHFFPYAVRDPHHWFARWRLATNARVLDVGCGSGELLHDLACLGFTRLLGIDPFLAGDVQYDNGVRLLKRTIHQVKGSFDVIMLHHSLEHIADQVETLRAIARLLAPGGECLIRTPNVASDAWEKYREHWAQLDAPRHLVIHSPESMRRAGEQAGLELAAVEFDSGPFQFTASELCRRGIPMREEAGAFSQAQVRDFDRRARELNARGRGDSAVYYFRRTSDAPVSEG